MKNLLPASAMALVLSLSAFGASWSGQLIDASCYQNQKKTDTCNATSNTTSFALLSAGKVYQLDTAGNSKAAEALKNRADRAADPNAKTEHTAVNATVSGTESAGTITVDSIDVN